MECKTYGFFVPNFIVPNKFSIIRCLTAGEGLAVLPDFTTCISMHEIALGAFHHFASESQVKELMTEGENLMTKIAYGSLKQRPLVLGKFDELNVALQDMKTKNSPVKYVIELQ